MFDITISRSQASTEAEPVSSKQTAHDEEHSLKCGWGMFRPLWLQRFRTAKWALFWLCWAGAIQGMLSRRNLISDQYGNGTRARIM
ncbi:hypothetical protein HF086_013847 [Spodoptera exigua]|uniref:Uncharacterized protein n=1 Tax=Spodoptera exigua TaxID=7107 RepID=A0A922MG12_SPOEX|nr:hypothetical protein HF086_013847 [Spodoptera exigua]